MRGSQKRLSPESKLADDSHQDTENGHRFPDDRLFARCQCLESYAFRVCEVTSQDRIAAIDQCQHFVAITALFLFSNDHEIASGNTFTFT